MLKIKDIDTRLCANFLKNRLNAKEVQVGDTFASCHLKDKYVDFGRLKKVSRTLATEDIRVYRLDGGLCVDIRFDKRRTLKIIREEISRKIEERRGKR